MGATSKEQVERKRVYEEISAMSKCEVQSKAAEAYRRRQQARIDDARRAREEAESQKMALEDQRARSWRHLDYQTPQEHWWASIKRCLKQEPAEEWS